MTESLPVEGSKDLSTSSPSPLYHRVLVTIREQIEDGTLNPGEQLPSEAQMCEEFGVSRGTLRRAIDELVQAKLIYKAHGVGTFVTESSIDLSLNALRGLVEELKAQGHDPEVRCLHRAIQLATPVIAEALQIREGEPVVYLKRLISSDGDALALTETYYPYKLCSALMEADPEVKIYEFLEQELGLKIDYAEQQITPAVASEEEAHTLSIPKDSLLFDMQWITYLDRGVPVFTGRSRLRADKYTMKVLLYRRNHKYG